MPNYPNRHLNGKTVLVIGGGQSPKASSPINNGRAICQWLSREGATVICADRDKAAAQLTIDMIRREGGNGSTMQLDIKEPNQFEQAIEQVRSQPRLDGVVLNVGISDRRKLNEITPESWDNIQHVNLRGNMLCTQAVLPYMKDGGAIVFISSSCAHLPLARNPAYEVSKAGVAALCRAVAQEGHTRGLRANVVVAGFVDTPMGRMASQARPERALRSLPFGRMATGWDIAAAAGFLISDQAQYINAIELHVDGGLAVGITREPAQSANDPSNEHETH